MIKRLIKTMLAFCLFVSIVGFTWQGVFDPNLITTWPKKSEKVGHISFSTPDGIMLIPFIRTVHIVPNDRAKVKTIKAFYVDYSLVSYFYYDENGAPKVFAFDFDKEAYEEIPITKEKAQSCVICHENYKKNGEELVIPPPPKPNKKEQRKGAFTA